MAQATDALADSVLPANAGALYTALKDGSVCEGWDMVCSYHLPELNAILKQNLAGKGDVTVPFTAEGQDFHGNFKLTGSVTLAPPTLKFVADRNGLCDCFMAIDAGTYIVTYEGAPPNPPMPIVTTSALVAQVSLSAIHGDGTPAQSGSGVVVFPSDPTTAHVVLHLKTDNPDEIAWRYDPPLTEVNGVLIFVLTAVKDYFSKSINEIDYVLTSVNPTPASGVEIAPTSFYMSTWGSDADGVLSLFINASPNTAGLTPPIVQHPMITQDHTCSLVLSGDFLNRGYFQPQQQGRTVGMAGKSPTYTIIVPTVVTVVGADIYGDWRQDDDSVEIDDASVDFNHYPYTLAFSVDALAISNSVSESSDYKAYGHSNKGVPSLDFTGTAHATITLAKNVPLLSAFTLDDKKFALSVNVASTDYSINIDPGGSHSCWNGDAQTAVSSHLQSAVQPVLQSLAFDFGDLNFFRATNLLFPDKSELTFDYGLGVAVPFDFVLLGNLKKAS